MIFILTLLPEVPRFLERICDASWWSRPVLVLFWPLEASNSHLLTEVLLIWSIIIISKILKMGLLSGWLMVVNLSPNSLCFPNGPNFVLFLVIKRITTGSNIEYLLCVKFHWGLHMRALMKPSGQSDACISSSPWLCVGSATHFGLEDAVEATLCLIQTEPLRRPGSYHTTQQFHSCESPQKTENIHWHRLVQVNVHSSSILNRCNMQRPKTHQLVIG